MSRSDERRPLLLLCAMSLACSPDEPTGTRAIFDASRDVHFFDLPFPSDTFRHEDGRPDLSGFPVSGLPLTEPLIEGWRTRVELATNGFATSGSTYFRFEGPLDLPSRTEGTPEDPILLIDLETHALYPLDIRFYDDSLGDPYLAPNLLAVSPRLTRMPPPGRTLSAVVMSSAGASPPANGAFQLDERVRTALDSIGIEGEVAVATTYTTQNASTELHTILDAAFEWFDEVDLSEVVFQRVTSIAYRQGVTPSGEDATVFTARFEDGTEESTYIEVLNEDQGNHQIDLDSDWPMAVYQASLPVPNFSGLENRPYMSPGLAHVFDTEEMSGWIEIVDGELVHEPDYELTRIVVSLPLDEDGQPLENVPFVIYDHGTGGHAYNSVQRRNVEDDGLALASVFAEEGYAVIGRDAPLYGTRYPLIDEGYGGSLGFYNITNLPAFRDNQRQAAIEGNVLLRFVRNGLDEKLPAGSIDSDRALRMGHSLGSVTTNIGVAAEPDTWDSVFLSGTGGLFFEYFLQTGLIRTIDPEIFETAFSIIGAELPEEITPTTVLGSALGIPEVAWSNIDRLHPLGTLFQWMMEPSDPIALAATETAPITVFIGTGDWQVPNTTSQALAEALPDSEVVVCTPTSDYDPHYCLHRETEGFEALRSWLQGDD